LPCLSIEIWRVGHLPALDQRGSGPTAGRKGGAEDGQGHPILFLSREKVRKNKIFKNNELKTGPLFRNTSPSESVHGILFGFDESLANNEL
jgi:hypothetical protein